MKKYASILCIVLLLLVVSTNIYAKDNSITTSVITDQRLVSWIVKGGDSKVIKNDHTLKFTASPAVSYYRTFFGRWDCGFETSLITRNTATGKFVGQLYMNSVSKINFKLGNITKMFIDLGYGPVYSFMDDVHSWGFNTAFGFGAQFMLTDTLSIGAETRISFVFEGYDNDLTTEAKCTSFGIQPAIIHLSYAF